MLLCDLLKSHFIHIHNICNAKSLLTTFSCKYNNTKHITFYSALALSVINLFSKTC